MLPAPAMEGGMRILEESFFWRESHFFWFKSEQGTKAAKEGKEDKKRERKRKNRLDPFLRLFWRHKICPNEKKLKLSLVLKGGLRLRPLELAGAAVEQRPKLRRVGSIVSYLFNWGLCWNFFSLLSFEGSSPFLSNLVPDND